MTFEEFLGLYHPQCGRPIGEHNYYGLLTERVAGVNEIICECTDVEAIYDLIIDRQTKPLEIL
jgi:hypothetical protein